MTIEALVSGQPRERINGAEAAIQHAEGAAHGLLALGCAESDQFTARSRPTNRRRRGMEDGRKAALLIGGSALAIALYIAGIAGFVYIGYLIVMALKKYIGA